MSIHLKTAIEAAKAAGRVHTKYYKTTVETKTKGRSYDFVTAADLEAEARAVACIRRRFKGHNIVAEENKYSKTGSEFCWIIDPLDGTNNFTFRLPIFCASVACARGDEVIAGAVYDAMRDELFYASKGQGAFLNGTRIRVSAKKTLRESLLITGFYYDRGERMVECLEHIKRFLQYPIVGLLRLGAAALDLCYVSCGRATGFWEFELNPWDFSAGKLIIQEAGGRVSDRRGEGLPLLERSFVVASNGRIHNAMLSVLR